MIRNATTLRQLIPQLDADHVVKQARHGAQNFRQNIHRHEATAKTKGEEIKIIRMRQKCKTADIPKDAGGCNA